jgi:hypothetical protein
MRTCYVALPFGQKRAPDGRVLDFDDLYARVIQPAVQVAGVECRRFDELAPGTLWHKELFGAVLGSDLMIADISTHNPNIFYELGVRHALRRGRTLLISAVGRLPSSFAYSLVLWYEPDGSGRLSGDAETRFRSELEAVIRQSERSTISDSPLYDLFPGIEVGLPPELEGERRRNRRPGARVFAWPSLAESPAERIRAVQESEEAVKSDPETDPHEYLRVMRRYRDLSAWDQLIQLASEAPPPVAASPEVSQLLALALNRRGRSGDQDRAITLMKNLIAETGGDSETFGILGRIYKDRYERAKVAGDERTATEDLEHALQFYRAGFEKNPKDHYLGINVVHLLVQRGGDAARGELKAMLPRILEVVNERVESGAPEFWDLATKVDLSVIAGDWEQAESAAAAAASRAHSAWMADSAVKTLRAFGDVAAPGDRERLDRIIQVFDRRATDA